MDIRFVKVILCLLALVLGSCSTEDANVLEVSTAPMDANEEAPEAGGSAKLCGAEEGSVTDVASEPDWRRWGNYRPWTDSDGCLLRIDVVAERPGPSHCGWEDADVLIVGQPLGAPYTSPENLAQFVRDPAGVFGQPELTAGFAPDANVPAAAVDSGFRRGEFSLWHVPGDQSAVWLVSEQITERWPRGQPPVCD